MTESVAETIVNLAHGADLPGTAPASPGTSLAIPQLAAVQAALGAHEIDVTAWARALAEQEQFTEADEEDRALSVLRAIVAAETPEAMFAAMDIRGVSDLLGPDPGARSNVYRIHSAKPVTSSFEEGLSCFAVITATDLAESTPVTLSCGGRAVQAALLALTARGWLPYDVKFTRRLKATANGFYPLNLEAGI